MSHTPGPWSVNHYRQAEHILEVRGDDGEEDEIVIADVHSVGGNGEANARLIAVAPELLAACQAALIELEILREKITPEYPAVKDGLSNQLRVAIAHATGIS